MTGRVLTSSELTTWLRCRRKWWLSYYRRLRTRRTATGVLAVGTLVHAGLESYYRDGADPISAMRLRANMAAHTSPEAADAINEAAGLAGIMLEGYLDWLAESGADAGLEPDGAEKKVETRLSDSFILRGKIDAQLRRTSDGARLQLEHKTVGDLVSIPKTAQGRFQFLTYDLLAYLDEQAGDGRRTDGVIVNMLKRVKRTKAAKPPFYGRHEVRHNTEELRSHWKHVIAIAIEMDRARGMLDSGIDHHLAVPPTVDRSCSWSCDFADVCPLFDDGSGVEQMLADQFEEHDPLARYEEEEE